MAFVRRNVFLYNTILYLKELASVKCMCVSSGYTKLLYLKENKQVNKKYPMSHYPGKYCKYKF